MKAKLFLPIALSMALLGCENAAPNKPGFVAKQWFEQIRELQVNVVFPPREDVQVGDIYITPQTEHAQKIIDSEDYLPISLLGAHANLNAALKQYYANRSSYPISTASSVPAGEAATNAATPLVPQATLSCPGTTSDCNIFTSEAARDLKRLRLVAFPDFLSTTISSGDVSVLIPVEAFTGQLGALFSRSKNVTLKIPVAESLSLPLLNALDELQYTSIQLCEKLQGKNPMSVNDEVIPPTFLNKPAEIPTEPTDEHLNMIAINEVFYTRAIDISVGLETEDGLGFDLDVVDPRIFKQPAPGTTLPSTPSHDTSGGTETAVNAAAAAHPGNQDLLSQIDTANAKLGQIMARTTPGAWLQITSVSSGQVGMRRTFARPIAIGYRGIWMELKYDQASKSCTVANLGTLGAGGGDIAPLAPSPSATPQAPVTSVPTY